MKNLADIFLQQWMQTTVARKQELLQNWHKRRRYTAIITGGDDYVMKKLAGSMNLRFYAEYYHTDGLLYTDEHLVPERQTGQTWVRGITIAFEHEHSYDNLLYQEISHLLILHSELSVLVTYPPERPDFRSLEHLDYFHKLVKESPRAHELDENESFLLIFGYENPFGWKGLVYKNDLQTEMGEPAGRSRFGSFTDAVSIPTTSLRWTNSIGRIGRDTMQPSIRSGAKAAT